MARNTACTSSTAAGCQCFEHMEGLLAHAQDRDAYLKVLERMKPTVLRVVAPPQDDAHDGSMTCGCHGCTKDRAGIRPQGNGNASPFRRSQAA